MNSRNKKTIKKGDITISHERQIGSMPFAFRFMEKVDTLKTDLLSSLGEEGTSDIVWTGDIADSIVHD